MGWYLTSLAWSSIRGSSVSWDPQVGDAITNGLLSEDFAASNLAVGAGSVRLMSVSCWSLKFMTGSHIFPALGTDHWFGK